jgi:hypothetical protein
LLETSLTGRLSIELLPLKALQYLDLAFSFLQADFGELINGLSNLGAFSMLFGELLEAIDDANFTLLCCDLT